MVYELFFEVAQVVVGVLFYMTLINLFFLSIRSLTIAFWIPFRFYLHLVLPFLSENDGMQAIIIFAHSFAVKIQ